MTYSLQASSTAHLLLQVTLHIPKILPPSLARFHQPHPSKQDTKLGQAYCPKAPASPILLCNATRLVLHSTAHALRCSCRCRCRKPRWSRTASRKQAKRYDTTGRQHSCIQQVEACHTAFLPTSARIYNVTWPPSGTLAGSHNPDCVCQRSHMYMRGSIMIILSRSAGPLMSAEWGWCWN